VQSYLVHIVICQHLLLFLTEPEGISQGFVRIILLGLAHLGDFGVEVRNMATSLFSRKQSGNNPGL